MDEERDTDINIIIAGCGSGKSNLARFLTHQRASPGVKVMMVKNDSVKTDWIDETFCITPRRFGGDVDKMLAFVSRWTEKGDGEKVVIIEDAKSMFRPKQMTTIERMFSIHRHTRTYFILITQNFKSIPPAMRSGEISQECCIWLGKQRPDRLKEIYNNVGSSWNSLGEYSKLNNSLRKFSFVWATQESSGVASIPLSNFEVRSKRVIPEATKPVWAR